MVPSVWPRGRAWLSWVGHQDACTLVMCLQSLTVLLQSCCRGLGLLSSSQLRTAWWECVPGVNANLQAAGVHGHVTIVLCVAHRQDHPR